MCQVSRLHRSQVSFTHSSQRRDKRRETAAKHASEPATGKLRNCLKVKGTNKQRENGPMAEGETRGWLSAFPWAFPVSLVAPGGGGRSCLHDSWCLQKNTEALWSTQELLLSTECNLSLSVLEVKCHHYVPQMDAVVVKVHA